MVILLAVVITRGAQNNCRAIGSLAPASSGFGLPADVARRNPTPFGPRDRRPTISLGCFRAANPAWRKLHLRRSGCRVPAFGEFLDYLPVKCWDVVGLSAGNQSVVDDHFFVHPARASIAHVDLDRRT